MSTLRIHIFGPIRVNSGSQTVGMKLIPTVRNLLAYILLNPHRSYPRDVLAGLTWGDRPAEQARNCLNTAIWRLRGILEPEGVPRGTYLTSGAEGEIGFNWDSDHWLDLEIFEDSARQAAAFPSDALPESQAHLLEESLQLYQAELLEGVYSDWAVRERERLRNLYLDCLSRLINYYKSRDDYEPAILFGQHILRLDPLREDINRELMRLLWLNGQRAQAVQQYETCRAVLENELGILPMPETRQLYEMILVDASPVLPEVIYRQSTLTKRSELQQALQQLHLAVDRLETARQEVQKSLAILDRYNIA